MIRACDRIIHWGLVSLIVFTPLAFGTVEPWAIALMEWGIVTLVLVYALSRLWPSGAAAPDVPASRKPALLGLALPIGLFLLLTVAQVVPMPLSWLRVISPGSARIYSSVDATTWERVQAGATEARAGRQDPLLQLQNRTRWPISVNPDRTCGRILLLGSVVALFFMVARWADGPRSVSILKAVTIVGFLVAVFGLVQLFSWNGKIYWLRKVPTVSGETPTAFGPFVNHDHFAGYVEMIIPVALSLAFWLVDRQRTRSLPAPPAQEGDRWGAALRAGLPEARGRLSQGTLASFVSVILLVSLFFSLSRGGILSACISGAVLLIMLCRRIASRLVRTLIVVTLPIVVIAIIALIGGEAVKKQLGTYASLSSESSFQMRAILWERLVRELPAYAWVGSGLGAFEDSFAPLTPAGTVGRWDRAHNDYLQLLWEAGIVGGILFALGAWSFARRFWWPALVGREGSIDLFRVGMAVSLLSIALHSIVDFCLQLGANAFLCALLAGLIVALHRGFDPSLVGQPAVRALEDPGPNEIAGPAAVPYIQGSVTYDTRVIRMVRKVLIVMCFTALLGMESAYFARACAAGIERIRGERAFFSNRHEQAWNRYRRALDLGGDRETLETDQIELLLFGLDLGWGGVRVRTALPPDQAVREVLNLAARRIAETPFKAYVWSLASDDYFHEARLKRQSTPLDLSALSEDPMSILLPEELLGLAALETASHLQPNNYIYHDLLAEKYLELGSIDKAATYCRRAVAANPTLGDHRYLLVPDLAPELLEAAIHGFEDSRLQDSMRQRARIECDAGELLRRNGQDRRAIDFLKRAVALSPDLYDAQMTLGIVEYQLNDYEGAIPHLREAVRCLPWSPDPNYYMGLALTALGDTQGAIDQFREAREKDPRVVKYFHLLGEALEKAGQIKEAERQFVAAAKLNPKRTDAWASLLVFYTRHRELRPLAEACSNLERMAPAESIYRDQCAALGLDMQ